MRLAQEKTAGDLRQLEKRLREMESAGPIAQERLRVAKDALHDLVVPESEYLGADPVSERPACLMWNAPEIVAIPEEQRSLREFAVVQVYERVAALRKQVAAETSARDAARKDLARLREKHAEVRASAATGPTHTRRSDRPQDDRRGVTRREDVSGQDGRGADGDRIASGPQPQAQRGRHRVPGGRPASSLTAPICRTRHTPTLDWRKCPTRKPGSTPSNVCREALP